MRRGKLKDECLQRNIFENLIHANDLIEEHRVFYNTIRFSSTREDGVPYDVYMRKQEYA